MNATELNAQKKWIIDRLKHTDDEKIISNVVSCFTPNLFDPIPGLPYTDEEKITSVRQAMADYRAGGRTYSSQEMREITARW